MEETWTSVMMPFSMDSTIAPHTKPICDHIRSYVDRFDNLYHDRLGIRWSIIILYCLVAVVGSAGNLTVLYAILRKSEMRTAHNSFIGMLAMSDLVMCTVTGPLTSKTVLKGFWDWGDSMCKFVSTIQTVNIFVSTMCITAISMDRYILIIFPLNIHLQKIVLVGCLVLVWCMAFLMASPMIVVTGLMSPIDAENARELRTNCQIELLVCAEGNWSGLGSAGKMTYTMFCFLFQYLLPLIGIIFWNFMISQRMAQRDQYFAERSKTRRRESYVLHRKIQRLVLAVVVAFAVTWLPFNIYMTIVAFAPGLYKIHIFAYCHIFGLVSSCINPVLYGVFNENFRREFSGMLETMNERRHTFATKAGHFAYRIHRASMSTTTTYESNSRRESSIAHESSSMPSPRGSMNGKKTVMLQNDFAELLRKHQSIGFIQEENEEGDQAG